MNRSVKQRLRARQQGVSILFTISILLLLVLFMALVMDTGRLYVQQRSLQRLADTVALEVASRGGCVSGSTSNNPGGMVNKTTGNPTTSVPGDVTLTATCGTISLIEGKRVFNPDKVGEPGGGYVRVIAQEINVRRSLVAGGLIGGTITLTASAVATKGVPSLAQLSIGSTTLTLNTAGSPLLNPIASALLGGNINLSAASWNDLVGANISLLNFLQAIPGVGADLAVGSYQSVLDTKVSVSTLTTAAISALGSGSTAAADLSLLASQAASASVGTVGVKLGDLLGLTTGGLQAGTDASLNVFQLVQTQIQLANGQNLGSVSPTCILPTGTTGCLISLQAYVIQKPQPSVIGDPSLVPATAWGATGGPTISGASTGAVPITVTTAQARLLVSINLGALNSALAPLLAFINQVSNSVAGSLASRVISLLNDLSLGNLVVTVGTALTSILGSVLGGVLSGLALAVNFNPYNIALCADPSINVASMSGAACPQQNLLYAGAGNELDIGLDAGQAAATVTGYTCSASSKVLNAAVRTSVANVALGTISSTKLFSSAYTLSQSVTGPASLIQIGYIPMRPNICWSPPGLLNAHLLSATLCSTSTPQSIQVAKSYFTYSNPVTVTATSSYCTSEPCTGTTGTWTTTQPTQPTDVLAGLGVQLSVPVAASSSTPVIWPGKDTVTGAAVPAPPDLGNTPAWQSTPGVKNIVGSLNSSLNGIQVSLYSTSGGLLGSLTTLLSYGLSALTSGLASAISALATTSLGGVGFSLDDLVNGLLNTLGLNVATAQVGANLTCGQNGVTLVR